MTPETRAEKSSPIIRIWNLQIQDNTPAEKVKALFIPVIKRPIRKDRETLDVGFHHVTLIVEVAMFVVKHCNSRAAIFEGSESDCEAFVVQWGLQIVGEDDFVLWVN